MFICVHLWTILRRPTRALVYTRVSACYTLESRSWFANFSFNNVNIETIARNLPAIFAALMVSILFIQSGLDKVFDWNGNLGWLKEHFSKTFLGPMVPLLLATLTVMELAAGVTAAVGIFYFLFTSSIWLMFIASIVAALSLTALFFGQRIAKDYPGAASIVPYFLLVGFLMFLTNPFSRV